MKKILFVDDEPEVLAGLRNLLRRQRRQWQMMFAVGGAEALGLVAEEHFDVVVSDLRMPEIDGVAVLSEVQKTQPEAVRIILSGYADQDMAMKAGAVAQQYLSKPCDAVTMINVLQRSCDLQGLITEPSLRRIVGKIEGLPVISRIYYELSQILSAGNVNAREVAVILEQDGTICAKLLQMVNSSFFRLAREVISIKEAVTYLGLETVKSLVLAAKVFDTSQSFPELDGITISAFQEHALHVATLGRLIAPNGLKDDVFTAAILHDIGILVLALGMPDQLREAFVRARQDERPLYEVEYEIYGSSHAEIGAYLLGLWGLPYPVVEAVANHHQPQRVAQQQFDLLAVVYTADRLIQETSLSCCIGNIEKTLEDRQDYWHRLKVTEHLETWRAMAHELAENRNGSHT